MPSAPTRIGWPVERPRGTMFVWAQIPEAYGGAGASYREAAAAAEVLGSHLAPVPFLGSAVVATAALLSVESQGDLLAKMADGGVTAALAVSFAAGPGSGFPASVRVAGPKPGDAGTGVARLRGMVSGVADALPAGILLVPADGVPHGLYLVDLAAEGVAKAPVTSLDMTRQLCDLSFDDAPATLIASGPGAERAVDAAMAAGAGILAAEQTGLAQRCLDMTLAYVKERRSDEDGAALLDPVALQETQRGGIAKTQRVEEDEQHDRGGQRSVDRRPADRMTDHPAQHEAGQQIGRAHAGGVAGNDHSARHHHDRLSARSLCRLAGAATGRRARGGSRARPPSPG